MSEDQIYCPIIVAGAIGTRIYSADEAVSTRRATECMKSKCGFWSTKNEGCAVKVLAEKPPVGLTLEITKDVISDLQAQGMMR